MSTHYIPCLILGFLITYTSTANTQSDVDDYVPFYDTGLKDEFDWKLLKSLDSYRNAIISPISLKLVLAVLYEGAGGTTEQEIQTVLKLNFNKTLVRQEFAGIIDSLQDFKKSGCGDDYKYPENTDTYTLNLGTRIFLDTRVKPLQPYQAKVCDKYQTKIEPTDFSNARAASDKINSWVERLTFGKINKLVGPDEVANSVLLITNAIYFKGFWRHQFPRNQTHDGGFYLTPREVVQVKYMATTDVFFFLDSKELDAKLIRIPYKGKKYSMIIILPNAKAGLSQLIQTVNIGTLKNHINIMDKTTVDLVLPRFKFDSQMRLSTILKKLGLVSMFKSSASLASITRDENAGLVVSEIVQKSGIDVNEEGSEAYAATDIQITNKFGDAQTSFNVTHPFLFFIEDQVTHTILFIGKVENPKAVDAVPVASRFGENTEPAPTRPATVESPSLNAEPALQLNPTWNEQDQALMKRFNYFDLELLSELSATTNENVFISPASIKATLGMVLEGAHGVCAEEISKTLRLPINQQNSRDQLKPLLYDLSDSNKDSILEFANGIFVSDKLMVVDEYKRVIENFYKGGVESLDFSNMQSAADHINGWVRNMTNGLVPRIVGPDNFGSTSTIVIANAVYFKGMWKQSFDEKSTMIKCFQLPSRECMSVYMMQNTAEQNYAMIEDVDAHAIELPYNDDKYAMLILVPRVKNNIHSLVRDLQHASFGAIIDKLEKTEVTYEIPRFDIEYTGYLINSLQKLGIREVFMESANLTGIVKNTQVRVDNVIQKTKIQVNEKGTEAAAATAAIVIPLMGSSLPRVTADHPFAFFIYKKDNRNILFEGIVNKPTEANPQTSSSYMGYNRMNAHRILG